MHEAEICEEGKKPNALPLVKGCRFQTGFNQFLTLLLSRILYTVNGNI